MKILAVLGGSGLLGSHAGAFFRNQNYQVYSTYLNHHPITSGMDFLKLDLADGEEVLRNLKNIKPSIILNCSGLTNVEECERNPDKARCMHGDIPSQIAKHCADKKIKYIHISTDHLWDGNRSFYKETDPTNPLNTYGRTKSEGEKLVLEANPSALVVRTNFFGNGTSWRQSFSDWAFEKLSQKENFFGFEDIFYSPISIPILLKYISDLMDLGAEGIFHIAGSERISKYHFILKYASIMNLSANHLSSAKYSEQTAAILRPVDMSLDTSRIASLFKKVPPTVEESIRSIL